MTSGALDKVHRFIEVAWGFPGVLLGSRVLRLMMPWMVLGDVAVSHRLHLAAKPSHMGSI
jgi:hypothetical protein